MAISSSDIKLRLSTTAGSAGSSNSGTGAGSLGKYISTTDMAGSTFDTISGADNAASVVDYRCVFVLNNHATLTLYSAVVYVSAEVSGGASVAIAVDNIAASAKGASSAQAATIASKTTAPSGVGSFSTPTTAGAGLSLGDIPAGSCRAVWIRRTAANNAAKDSDGFTLAVTGDTSA